MAEQKKQFILCPVCKKAKFYDLRNSHGENSVRCYKCGHYVILNWDAMTAEEGGAIKAS